MKLSILQKATIVDYCSEKDVKLNLFRQLAEASVSPEEKELLLSAVSEIKKLGYVDTATQEIYEKRFPHKGAPFFPFLELCYLPELFRKHDLIRYKGKVYDVEAVPHLHYNCDFSDECYLCYPLVGKEHQHIHVCEAERPTNQEVLEAMQQYNKHEIIREYETVIRQTQEENNGN